MPDPLTETWQIHNRINLFLLDAIDETTLAAAMDKCRSVYDLFAHMHNVRLMWLKPAAPELLKGLEKLEAKTAGSKKKLRDALEASGKAIETLLRQANERGGKVKGFKPHATAFLGYLISHESHHRGQIGWTLKQTGHRLDATVAYALWDWAGR